MNGIDTPYSTLGKAHTLYAAGVRFVIRYASPNSDTFPNKQSTTEEIAGLRSVGIQVGLVYERLATTLEFADPEAHAQTMISVANACGWPQGAGKALYFACDFDFSRDDYVTSIKPYFASINPLIKDAGFLSGAYGSGQICYWLWLDGLIHYRWRAQSQGWAGWPLGGDILQGPGAMPEDCAGLSADTDTISGSAGLW